MSQTTVTGKLLTINAVPPGGGSFVKFQLRGFEPQVPRVIGTNLIVDAIEFDAYPDGTGSISVSVTDNASITPLSTFYHISIFQGGILYVEFDTTLTGATVNLNALIATGGCLLPPTSVRPKPCVADISFFFQGVPTANESVGMFTFATAVSFPSNLVGSVAIAGVAATANTIFSIQKNGTQFGTITFAGASTSGVFAGVPTNFATGDVLNIQAPAIPDLTLANISITLEATVT